MRIISRRRLRDFAEEHADAGKPLDLWYALVKSKSYSSPHEVKEDFPTASFLGDRKTVFNVGGNKYRLVVDMRYDLARVYIRHVVTHKEYDRLVASGQL